MLQQKGEMTIYSRARDLANREMTHQLHTFPPLTIALARIIPIPIENLPTSFPLARALSRSRGIPPHVATKVAILVPFDKTAFAL